MAGRRSRLELYIATIEVLSDNSPMNLSRLALRTRINISPLKAILCDLLEKRLVEERKIKESIFYTAAPGARTVLSHFDQLNQLIQLAQEP